MTIDTQRLRQVAASVRSFLRPQYGREIAAAAEHIDAQAAQLSAYPADWREDSSLETWFPLTAEQVNAQAAEIARLKKALRVAAMALAHATQEHGKVYRPAYVVVDAALSGEGK